MAVTRMTPMNSKPPNTWVTAGYGIATWKLETDSDRLASVIPPKLSPAAVDTHAMIVPTAMATKPAGVPRKYRTPPNQLARMIAKQGIATTGTANMSSAGRIEMNVTDTPASVPRSAALGVTLRMMGATKPPAIKTKL
jgi:hypothetical protein